MEMRTLYLQRILSVNGRDSLGGRILYDEFRKRSKESLLGHFVTSDEDAATYNDLPVGDDVISYDLFKRLDPNVIYLEGGLFMDGKGTWRIPRAFAEEFVAAGGVMIVADADANELREKKQPYADAGTFLQARASYVPPDGDEPEDGRDEVSNWGGATEIYCKPERMVVSDWLRTAYEGIDKILVGLPVRLNTLHDIVASGNLDTTKTRKETAGGYDFYEPDSCIFGSAAKYGSGYVVFIAASVSGDAWSKQCPANVTWLTNVAQCLVDDVAAHSTRAASHLRSKHRLFLSHRSVDKKLVAEVAEEIKREGVGIWFDQERLVPSDSLVGEISRGLRDMSHFVLFWSKACEGARWVELELENAVARLVEQQLPIFLVRLDDAPVPAILAHLFRIEVEGLTPSEIGKTIVDAVKRLEKRKHS